MAHNERGYDAKGIKSKNPDKGPRMMEGAHSFDKGYVSDEEYAMGPKGYPADQERGNEYLKMAHEIRSKDSKKLQRSKFSKIA
jgi:hypothetical protein